MLTTKELREKRMALAEEARTILTKAAEDKREALKSEEQEKWETLHGEIDKLAKHIELRERQDEEERRLQESAGRQTEATQPGSLPVLPGGNGQLVRRMPTRIERGMEDSREALRAWLFAGSDQELTAEHHEIANRVGINLASRQIHLKLSRTPLRDLRDLKTWEYRAQSVGTTTEGGFTVPDELMRPLEAALLEFGGMRSVATILRTDSGANLPIPTTNDTANKGVILGENTVVAEQDIVFAQLVLEAYKYSSKMILVSVELLQDNSVNLAEFIGRALGERIGRITNDHFTTGTGTAQPNGIVTASTQGKVGATGQTVSVIYEDLVDLQHSVDPAYRMNARWMFADSTLKAIKKLKDGDDRPLWSAGLAVREPDTILGHPYVINQSMAVMAANAKSILFGALDKYLIRDVVNITLLRLDERFADFHQVAFLAFSRHDGDLLNAGTNPVKHFANSAT